MINKEPTLPTWMVVEDEPDIYDVLLAMFEIWGIEGVAFVDGAEAVSWVDEVDHSLVAGELPELALLDIRLPEVSGPEVGARLRKSPKLGNLAIVLITAYRLTPQEEDAVMRQAQADLLMYKPLPGMPELRAKLNAIIASRKARTPLAVTDVATVTIQPETTPSTSAPTMPAPPVAPATPPTPSPKLPEQGKP